jgi:hypothetical protein
MKQLPALLIAAFVVGFLAFAFSYWIMQMEYRLAWITGVAAGFAGLVVELLKPLWQKKKNPADKGQDRKS